VVTAPALVSVYVRSQASRRQHLEHFTRATTICLSSDPRDRIYAFLAIAEEVQDAWSRGPYDMIPEYSIKDPLELLRKVLDLRKPEHRSGLPILLLRILGGTKADLERGGPWP
jgi:hypothetical protein